MKLATYEYSGSESYGIVRDQTILDIPSALPDGPADLRGAIEAGGDFFAKAEALQEETGRCLQLDQVRLLAPIPRPGKVIGLAVNYVAHHYESERNREMPDDPSRTTTPRPFIMPGTVVANPGDEIPWPVYSEQIDHEVELAVVIGTRASRIPTREAAKYIGGFTIANDISARSCTHADGRSDRGEKDGFFDWLHGKWADGFCPLGPWMVTPDEIDPTSLDISLDIDGDRRQDANTAQMIFDVYGIVSFCSHLMTLEPGDVIATGTPSGVGMATGKLLKGGETMTCRIQGIGELVNTLGPRPGEFYRPCANR
jgi:2-keto-4-pentenoate hydratase/2-oxohepta-3-ene-1,7-dioic acid hydratase in catechol pathway